MPYKGLISDELQNDIGVCAIGCVGVRRGIDMSNLDPDDYETIARVFGISRALAQEIEFMNDEWANTPQQRFQFVRKWVVEQIRKDQP